MKGYPYYDGTDIVMPKKDDFKFYNIFCKDVVLATGLMFKDIYDKTLTDFINQYNEMPENEKRKLIPPSDGSSLDYGSVFQQHANVQTVLANAFGVQISSYYLDEDYKAAMTQYRSEVNSRSVEFEHDLLDEFGKLHDESAKKLLNVIKRRTSNAQEIAEQFEEFIEVLQ